MKNKIVKLLFTLTALPLLAFTLDLNNPINYAKQTIPDYINEDNSSLNNPITDLGATLGRVLFYDKLLSSNQKIACASCHLQEFAFSDTAVRSVGVNDTTGRHSMRLINVRFTDETRFFWDERAETLEEQATMPIKDHGEMGYSGKDGDLPIDSLFSLMQKQTYYTKLFIAAFGDDEINEDRIQKALSQFMRTIQSFDSRFDSGMLLTNNENQPFPNFTPQENAGKQLYMQEPIFDGAGNRIAGGVGCNGCHVSPEFDLDILSLNNGIIGSFTQGFDFDVTRSPTLRDILNYEGRPNGGFFHLGLGGPNPNLDLVINHYNNMPSQPQNPNLDPRMGTAGDPRNLQMTPQERNNLKAFLATLSGKDVYTNERWSNPFDSNGKIEVIGLKGLPPTFQVEDFKCFPNPVEDNLFMILPPYTFDVKIYSSQGKLVYEGGASRFLNISTSDWARGLYIINITRPSIGLSVTNKILKH